ncbi:MAG: N-acyl-D-amino-acid deacylase, partial [Verrucomicrobiales bacterium]
MKLLITTIAVLWTSPLAVWADDQAAARLGKAIDAGLKTVQKAAASYPENRSCFSCHHQSLPMLAMVEARTYGATIDSDLLQEQAVFTHDFYKERTEKVAKGEGVGGRSMTVAYSLWALDLAGRKPDQVSDALTDYLLKRQNEDGHWQLQSHRPPLEESDAMTTFLAAYYMGRIAQKDRKAAVAKAVEKATRWLAQSKEKSQEDSNAKLWALAELGEDTASDKVAGLRAKILENQNDDGGWSQLPDMESDAYATGQTLFILDETGLADSDPAVRRGVEFLLKSQKPDGSWLVETRSKPVQKFFDNGDPHGKHQFISIAATSWA